MRLAGPAAVVQYSNRTVQHKVAANWRCKRREDGYDFELLPGTVDTSGNVTIGATEAPAAATA